LFRTTVIAFNKLKISKDIKLVDYKISFEDVFNENILKVVKDLVYEKLERIEECDDFSYENFRVPLTPDDKTLKNIRECDNYSDLFTNQTTLYKLKTSDVIPFDMLEYDLGKKDDLIKVFEHLTNLFKDCKTFRFIKADIAIFVPYWKIVLTTNQNDIYKPLFIFLGVWHIFKIMVERIWFEFFDVFWWRFSVNIYKDQTQLKKPKLNYLLNFFFNLQIQFEFVREDFEKFLQDDKNPY
jgi:hypothetical protein